MERQRKGYIERERNGTRGGRRTGDVGWNCLTGGWEDERARGARGERERREGG